MSNSGKRFTSAGTDIEEVKRRNAQSGLSYNDVYRALTSGTDPQQVKEEIAAEAGPFPSGNKAQLGKTVAGTNIAEVKAQNMQAGNGKGAAFGASSQMEEFGSEASFSSSNKAQLGKTVAGTNIAEVKAQNMQAGNGSSAGFSSSSQMEELGSEASFSSSNKAQLGKTVAGTDIAKVKRQNANPSSES